MQTLLIVFTVMASMAAAAMCAIVIRMLREERRRSDARVEALLAMAGEARDGDAVESSGASLAAAASAAAWHAAVEPRGAAEGVRNEQAVAEISGTLDRGTRTEGPWTRDQGDQGTTASPLFALHDTASPWGRRVAAVAALALVVLAGALAVGARDSGSDVATAADAGAGAPQAAPIELLSLSHAAESGALTITGLVQNPRGGRAMSDISAVAFLLDRGGGTIATGSAPLDFRRLDAGAESPFVVKVPVSGRVDRYRIGFRDARGGVIAHVDRRNAGPIARRD